MNYVVNKTSIIPHKVRKIKPLKGIKIYSEFLLTKNPESQTGVLLCN